MAKTKEFQDKLLICTKDGKNLGEVKDIYFDAEFTRIVAVHLGRSGIINRKSQMIDLSHVKLFGIDAWLVDDSEIVIAKEDTKEAENYVLGDSVRGREIQTDGGTKIGTVGDVIVDGSHNVLGFALGKIQVQGPIAESKTIARAAITDFGTDKNPMIAVLEQAEKLNVAG